MNVTVLTADYAQADDRGKLHAIGLAWNTVTTPLPPHGIAIIFEIDWSEADRQHAFTLELVDEDGHLVSVDGASAPIVRLESSFEVARPPGEIPGTPLAQVFAVNFPGGMPLAAGHRFQYRVSTGETIGSTSFAVTPAQ